MDVEFVGGPLGGRSEWHGAHYRIEAPWPHAPVPVGSPPAWGSVWQLAYARYVPTHWRYRSGHELMVYTFDPAASDPNPAPIACLGELGGDWVSRQFPREYAKYLAKTQ